MVQQYTPRRSWVKKLSKYYIAIALIGLNGACAEPVQFRHNPVSVLPMGSLERSWFVDLDSAKDPVVRIGAASDGARQRQFDWG